MTPAEYQKAKDIYAQGLKFIPKSDSLRTGMKDADFGKPFDDATADHAIGRQDIRRKEG